MKFFEFGGDSEYYALIVAKDEKDATKVYEQKIGSLDDDFEGTKEISEKEARKKFAKGKVESGIDDVGFDETVKHAPSILLIDGELA